MRSYFGIGLTYIFFKVSVIILVCLKISYCFFCEKPPEWVNSPVPKGKNYSYCKGCGTDSLIERARKKSDF